VLVLVQGWKSFSPVFSPVDFVSFYIELPILVGMFVIWKVLKRTRWVRAEEMDLVTDRFDVGMSSEEREEALRKAPRWKGLTWRERGVAAGTALFL
jgi:AAT family amino acid transporter